MWRVLGVLAVLVATFSLTGCQTSVTETFSGLVTKTKSVLGISESEPQASSQSSANSSIESQASPPKALGESSVQPETKPQFPSSISGVADVIDGDTITVDNQRVRLYGIDAPEHDQTCLQGGKEYPCGTIARNALIGFTTDVSVVCKATERDRYGRLVGICRTGDFDLSRGLVGAGLALAYRQYSDLYVGDENEAKAGKRGMWKGRFVAPWDWRRGQRLTSQ